MNKKTLFLIIFLFCFISNIQAQKNQKYSLSYNFKAGTIYYVEISATQQIKMMEMEMPQIMVFGADFEVMSVGKKGNAIVKMTYKRIKFEQDNPQAGKISYDSNSKEEPKEENKAIAFGFGQLIDKYVTMEMQPTGKIIKIIDGDERLQEALKKDNNFATYPTKKLKIGDSWISKEKRDISGKEIFITSKVILKDVKDGQFFLESTSEMKNKTGEKIGDMTGKSILQQNDVMIGIQKTLQKMPDFESKGYKMDILSEIIVDGVLKK